MIILSTIIILITIVSARLVHVFIDVIFLSLSLSSE